MEFTLFLYFYETSQLHIYLELKKTFNEDEADE